MQFAVGVVPQEPAPLPSNLANVHVKYKFSPRSREPQKPDFGPVFTSAVRWQSLLEQRSAQVLFGLVALLPVFVYAYQVVVWDSTLYDMYRHDDTETFKLFVLINFLCAIPLVLSIALELAVRVEAQGGRFWRVWSWAVFFKPMYHKLEGAVLAFLLTRLAIWPYLMFVAYFEIELQELVYADSSDLLNIAVTVGHRFLRFGGIAQEVSVQTSLRKRWERENAPCMWMDELELVRSEFDARFSSRLQKLGDRKEVQWIVVNLAVLHAVFFGLSTTFEAFAVLYGVTKFTGWLLLTFFIGEFVVRCWAQGGDHFFIPNLHKAEVCVLAALLVVIFRTTWMHRALQEKGFQSPYGTITFVLVMSPPLLALSWSLVRRVSERW